MLQTKTIMQHTSVALDTSIEEYLSKNEGKEVVALNYQFAVDEENYYYSCMIVLKDV